MMQRKTLFAMFFIAAFMSLSFTASGLVHVARSGETLEQLALRYYNTKGFSIIIRAANGFMHPDNGRLIPGEIVEIPEVTYHRVTAQETWTELSDRYLGTPRRGKYLAELNNLNMDNEPVEGKVIIIPYQLLYVLAPDETLKRIAGSYLSKRFSAKWLKRYNLKKKKKYGRGDALLIPLMTVEIIKKERAKLKKNDVPEYSGEDQRIQSLAVAQIAKLREDFEEGRYVQIVANAHRLIGTNKLTVPQLVGVYKFLAFAYVAFDKKMLAQAAFRKALDLQPGMVLSPITTSPKILNVFKEAFKLPIGSVNKNSE